MDVDAPIVRPQGGSKIPRLGPTAVLAATAADMRDLGRLLEVNTDTARRLFISQVYAVGSDDAGYTLAGP